MTERTDDFFGPDQFGIQDTLGTERIGDLLSVSDMVIFSKNFGSNLEWGFVFKNDPDDCDWTVKGPESHIPLTVEENEGFFRFSARITNSKSLESTVLPMILKDTTDQIDALGFPQALVYVEDTEEGYVEAHIPRSDVPIKDVIGNVERLMHGFFLVEHLVKARVETYMKTISAKSNNIEGPPSGGYL